MLDMHAVSQVSKHDDVMCIQRDVLLPFVTVENVLHDVYYADVIVMTPFRK